MFEEVVVEFIAGAKLEDEPYQRLGDYDFVETGDVWVEELAVVVNLASEVGVILLGRLEDDLERSVVVTMWLEAIGRPLNR